MELVWAALGAVNPYQAVSRHLRLEGSDSAPPSVLHIGPRSYDTAQFDRMVVVGAGKAGAGMAAAVEALMGDLVTEGWVNVRYGYESPRPLDLIHIHPAGHPNPDEAGIQGTSRILDILSRLTENEYQSTSPALMLSPPEEVFGDTVLALATSSLSSAQSGATPGASMFRT